MEELQNLKEERKRGKDLKAKNKQESDCTIVELKKAFTGFNSRLFCSQSKYLLEEKHNILGLGFSGALMIQVQCISNPGLKSFGEKFHFSVGKIGVLQAPQSAAGRCFQ